MLNASNARTREACTSFDIHSRGRIRSRSGRVRFGLAASTLPPRSQLTIIAFDPGVTTGIAVLDDDGSIVETFALPPDQVERYVREIRAHHMDARAVAEAPPQHGGNYRAVTQGVEEVVKRFYPDAHWANPGQWKGTPASRTQVPRGLTQHEKDAVHLGRWFKSIRRTLDRTST